ncbi:DUF732 domain-containing protein [Mycobacterium sp. NPDC003323]
MIEDMALLKSLALSAALIVAGGVTAAPAVADDETFRGALEMIGVVVDSPAAAGEMGRAVCAGFDAGHPLPAVADQLAAGHGVDLETAGMIAGFSVAEYCDHHKGALSLG